jgi:hypothetical protein
MSWWKNPKQKICFLCAAQLEDSYGELKYAYEEDGQKVTQTRKICALCVKRLDESEVSDDGESV